MASVNKAILMGNLGRDPEVRYSSSGLAVCNISLATSSKRKDKQSGEYVEETQWHRVTFYDKLAEIVGKYATKGRSIYVEGRITYRKYSDKDGVEKTSTEIVASEMQLIGSGGHDDKFGPEGSRPVQAPASKPAANRASGFDEEDPDGIPF